MNKLEHCKTQFTFNKTVNKKVQCNKLEIWFERKQSQIDSLTVLKSNAKWKIGILWKIKVYAEVFW